jgi:hypothetical protein
VYKQIKPCTNNKNILTQRSQRAQRKDEKISHLKH